MIICGESLGHLGKNEAKILVGSDSVLSVDQKWDFEKMTFAQIQQITFKATLSDCFASLKVDKSQKW